MKQSQFVYLLYLVPSVGILCAYSVTGTSLVKRIREKQNADEAMIKGLDMTTDNWLHIPQPIQDVLMSIDDKLRGLDTLSYTLKLARLDFSLEQLVRRMENIETKIGRLETKFDLRMEKIEEVVVSKDIKEEFSNEQLSRRMENLNEKINNKVAYLDAKLDLKLERVMNKLELLERDLHNSADDILERLIKSDERHTILDSEILEKDKKIEELGTNMNEMKIFMKEELTNLISKNFEDLNLKLDSMQTVMHNKENKSEKALTDIQANVSSTRERMLIMLESSNNKIDNLSAIFTNADRSRSSLDMCDTTKTITKEQLDNLTMTLEKTLTAGEAKFKELDSDVEQYTRKIINGIQELWRTSDELKIDLSNTLEQGSKTREMVRQEFQRLQEQIPKLEPKLNHISEDLDKKVYELSTTVDNSFATLLVAQNTFIDSCKRIQQEEMHIYEILQQIVYEMRNRSIADIYRITSELQTQSTLINRSLAHVLTAVLLTGNITTSAVNDLIEQLKQKDHSIILKADNMNWNTLESICNQLAAEDQLYDGENIRNEALLDAHNSDSSASNYSIRKSEKHIYSDSDSDHADDSGLHLHDYELEYQLSETEYKGNI